MNTACLEYCLTEAERATFERDGYLIVEDVLPPALIQDLTRAVDRIDAEGRKANGLGAHETQNVLDFIGRDDVFLKLLDWPVTFPKVWGILGWNIQLYHSHMIITPPRAPDQEIPRKRLGWHQDSGRLNREIETTPQPRISLKVAFFLTDTSELGRANLYVIPGSQRINTIDWPSDPTADPAGAVAVRAKAGSAVFFDRRIWHASSPNDADFARKVLFYGYSYRWLRPRDDMTVAHYLDRCDPIQQQLLGVSHTGGHGYSSPKDVDVPLRTWLIEQLGAEAVPA
jgi:ectoine hydroxylase-related dioxygenase (phytanoyl-CoA dioxygenase family)